MNKYVLIPHDQYLSFKTFAAENMDKSENVLESPAENNQNIIKTDNSDEKQQLDETNQLNRNLYSESREEIRHPLPPPGLPAEGIYTSNATYLSKIGKKERKNQGGRGSDEWIKKWNKKF